MFITNHDQCFLKVFFGFIEKCYLALFLQTNGVIATSSCDP